MLYGGSRSLRATMSVVWSLRQNARPARPQGGGAARWTRTSSTVGEGRIVSGASDVAPTDRFMLPKCYPSMRHEFRVGGLVLRQSASRKSIAKLVSLEGRPRPRGR